MKADAISGYRIEHLIGKGGMASVYLAIQQALDRPVALKVLRDPDSETFSNRFINEGRIIASLSHANIITVYDVGIVENWHYISMEYVEGGDLKQLITKDISVDRALKITQALAACLEFAHSHGVIHRDVKPANILFRADDSPVLTDFGIAKQFETDTDQTTTGTTIGTPYYISPEQAQAHSVDGRADIYSLGIILYEMLTGKRPYVGDSDIATLLMHIRAPIPKLPAAYSRYQILLERMIAKAPEQRFSNAGAVIDLIKTLDSSILENIGATQILTASEIRQRFDWPTLRIQFSKILPNVKKIGTALGSLLNRNSWSSLSAKLWSVAPNRKIVSTELRSLLRRIDWPPIHAKSFDILQDRKIIGVGLGSLLLILGVALTFSYTKQPGKHPPESQREQATLVLPANTHGHAKQEPVKSKESPPNNQAEQLDNISQPTDPPISIPKTLDAEQSTNKLDKEETKQPTQSSDQQIKRLLKLAQESLEAYRLTTPSKKNALQYYEEVLELDPKNKEAAQGFSEIAKRYAWLVAQQIERGNYTKAKEYLNRGLQIDPGNRLLIALSQMVYEPSKKSNKKANESPDQGPLDRIWNRMKNLFR